MARLLRRSERREARAPEPGLFSWGGAGKVLRKYASTALRTLEEGGANSIRARARRARTRASARRWGEDLLVP